VTGTESGWVDDLPPSAKYVLKELDQAGGELSRRELVDELCHHERTIAGALKTLENRGYIFKDQNPADLREVVVKLADERRYNPSRD